MKALFEIVGILSLIICIGVMVALGCVELWPMGILYRVLAVSFSALILAFIGTIVHTWLENNDII